MDHTKNFLISNARVMLGDDKTIISRDKPSNIFYTDKQIKMAQDAEFGNISKGIFHDLINPLLSVTLCVEMLEKHVSDGTIAEAKKSIITAVQSANRLKSYMNSIRRGIDSLDESHKMADLRTELNVCLDLLSYKCRHYKTSIEIQKFDNATIYAHPVQVHQILINALNNCIDACTLTDRFRKISISISKRKMVSIIIKDTGPGFPKQFMRQIGTIPFSTKESGTGMGLMTIAHVLKKIGGTFRCLNQPRGQGAIYHIRIPIIGF